MNPWPLFAATIYQTLRIASGSRVEVVDEGGLAALRGVDPIVVVANHQSHADTPLIAAAMPRERRPLLRYVASARRFSRAATGAPARERVERWFLHGMAVHAYGALLVGEEHVGPLAIGAMARLLDEGKTVVVFPEGTRSRTGALGPLRPGAAIVALEAKVRVVPIRIDGAERALPRSAWHVRRGSRIRVRLRAPIVPAPSDDHESLTRRIEQAIAPAESAA